MQDLNPLEWALLPVKRYAVFNGRAPRAEYWWFSIIFGLISGLLTLLDSKFFSPVIGVHGPLGLFSTLALFIPSIAVDVRRLHDINRSGWWILLNFWALGLTALGMAGRNSVSLFENIPTVFAFLIVIVGLGCLITNFVFMVTRGTEGPNAYGPDPYGPGELEEVFA